MGLRSKNKIAKVKGNTRLHALVWAFLTWGIIIAFYVLFIGLMIWKQKADPTITYLAYIAAVAGIGIQITIMVMSLGDPRPLRQKTELHLTGKLNRSDGSKLGLIVWLAAVMVPIAIQSSVNDWTIAGLSNSVTTAMLWGLFGFFMFCIPTYLAINYKFKLTERGTVHEANAATLITNNLNVIRTKDHVDNINLRMNEKSKTAVKLQQQAEFEAGNDNIIMESRQNIAYNQSLSQAKIMEQERERRTIDLEVKKENAKQELLESKENRDIRLINRDRQDFNSQERKGIAQKFFTKPQSGKMEEEPEGRVVGIEQQKQESKSDVNKPSENKPQEVKTEKKSKTAEFDESEYNKFQELKEKTQKAKTDKKTRK